MEDDSLSAVRSEGSERDPSVQSTRKSYIKHKSFIPKYRKVSIVSCWCTNVRTKKEVKKGHLNLRL